MKEKIPEKFRPDFAVSREQTDEKGEKMYTVHPNTNGSVCRRDTGAAKKWVTHSGTKVG